MVAIVHILIVLPGPGGVYRWIRSLRLEVCFRCCEPPEHSRYPRNIWWTDGQVNEKDGWMDGCP